MRQTFLQLLIILGIGSLLLSGCMPASLKAPLKKEVSEQLYIDARLDFATKHPLGWERIIVPVSSPAYRADTVRWRVNDSEQQHAAGKMLIRSLLNDPERELPDLLSSYLSGEPELKSSQVEELELPAGPALKLVGHDERQGRLIIALKGQARDFIISFDAPASRFDELRPVFQDIINSFVEIVRPLDPET